MVYERRYDPRCQIQALTYPRKRRNSRRRLSRPDGRHRSGVVPLHCRSRNRMAATYLTIQQALAMGLRDGDLSEIVKVIERAVGYQLPETRD